MEIAKQDAAGNIIRRYVPGAGTDIRAVMIHVDPTGGGMGVEQGRYYYVADRLGHVIAMVDQGGVAVDHYIYSPYGVQDRLSGSGKRSQHLTPPERRRRVHPYTGRKYYALTGLYPRNDSWDNSDFDHESLLINSIQNYIYCLHFFMGSD